MWLCSPNLYDVDVYASLLTY